MRTSCSIYWNVRHSTDIFPTKILREANGQKISLKTFLNFHRIWKFSMLVKTITFVFCSLKISYFFELLYSFMISLICSYISLLIMNYYAIHIFNYFWSVVELKWSNHQTKWNCWKRPRESCWYFIETFPELNISTKIGVFNVCVVF